MSASGVIVKEVVGITIEPEAVMARLVREGTCFTYVLPPRGVPHAPVKVSLADAAAYCERQLAVCEAKSQADPASDLYATEAAIFAGLVRLIDSCRSSPVIKQELLNLARDRKNAEVEQVAGEAVPSAEAEVAA